ncbi:MFS general substrate transporter [Laetiporus sulphureus 93-53]|uniref:MFS general substrate transporter n=1 Tax=Laetiporus sulphureus 93-53 TaxID=1314785 RepID=A0A165AYV3_9APHY|nr:MFS general substrate transporter [Laetiporus sulphureus 93-53]KZS99914.1 MFS general substrate transporter [Laetiporus sulphureus 93-53]
MDDTEKPPMRDCAVTPPEIRTEKGTVFWLIFLSICISLFLSALELTAVSTALPTIAHDLQATDFVWAGSAYALSSTAFLPMSGNFAQIFGRRPALLTCLALFALGSGISGGATSMPKLIAGRTVQSLSAIILSDLVTLRERGLYAGLFGLTWVIASVIGPIVGGSLAANGHWRWLFYLNLPIAGLAATFVLVFLRLPTPPGTFREKLRRVDWIGNMLIISSSTSVMIALTWGGVTAPWASYRVLVPLVLGLVGLAFFILYESIWAIEPLVNPCSSLLYRGMCSYFTGANLTIIKPHKSQRVLVQHYFPVFWQGCKDASPIRSGVLGLGVASLAPASIFAGVGVNRTRRYRPQMWAGWCLIMIGLGLYTTLTAHVSEGRAVGFSVIVGVGIGFEYSTTIFPVQAPLSVTQNAHALTFLMFIRSFAGVWGVTIGSTVLQNELVRRLPSGFLANFPASASIAYSLIPEVPYLPSPLKQEVQAAFAESLNALWEVLLGVGGLGVMSSLLMKGLPLHGELDKDWAMSGET